MSQVGQIEVRALNSGAFVERYDLKGDLAWIGSHAANQITLSGENIVARHAQLIPANDERRGYLLINHSQQPLALHPAKTSEVQWLSPRKEAYLTAQDAFVVGNCLLVFQDDDEQSTIIQVVLTLKSTRLTTTQPLWGQIKVSYSGEKSDVDFKVTMEGVPAENYYLDQTGATLSGPGDFTVDFRLIHTKRSPIAGKQRITLVVSAPSDYPNERASASRFIEVAPCFLHQLETEVVKSELDDYSLFSTQK
jgi:hypothetical protein